MNDVSGLVWRGVDGEYSEHAIGLWQAAVAGILSSGMNGVLIGAFLIWRGVAGEYGEQTLDSGREQ